jgi:hypothetical protein
VALPPTEIRGIWPPATPSFWPPLIFRSAIPVSSNGLPFLSQAQWRKDSRREDKEKENKNKPKARKLA